MGGQVRVRLSVCPFGENYKVMTDEETTRCEHLACLCEVPFSEGTCSPYCASDEGRDPQNVLCKCGHPKCEQQIETQLHGGAGRES